MRIITLILGILLIAAALVDAFESILLPRRVSRRFRYSRFYYQGMWSLWRRMATVVRSPKWRESLLSFFGPLSMLGLFGFWVIILIVGFATLEWSLNMPLTTHGQTHVGFGYTTCLYYSGTTFFTLGLGDILPLHGWARLLTVTEAGLGFGFLAVIIAYLPVLYQAFSRREVTISLLDARAGSPPSGGEFMARLAHIKRIDSSTSTLREWEQWCGELLESHISFPVLAYYRSQHGNQSWLAALATMLDASSMLIALLPQEDSHQAQLTFAMARHAAVDIALIFAVRPKPPQQDRLRAEARTRLAEMIRRTDKQPSKSPEGIAQFESFFTELRGMYEPFLEGLSNYFLLNLPPVMLAEQPADNWQRSAWMPHTRGIGSLPPARFEGEHFDISARKATGE